MINFNQKEIEFISKLQSLTRICCWNRILIVIVVQINWNPNWNRLRFDSEPLIALAYNNGLKIGGSNPATPICVCEFILFGCISCWTRTRQVLAVKLGVKFNCTVNVRNPNDRSFGCNCSDFGRSVSSNVRISDSST